MLVWGPARVLRRSFLFAGAAALIASRGRAQGEGGAGHIALSGDRFAHNDSEYQLADVKAPSLYALHGERPHFNESTAMLQSLLDGALRLTEVAEPSRWGVRSVIATDRSGDDLAALLVGLGAARVAPQTDDFARIDLLLSIEDGARRDKLGLWGYDAYRLREANDVVDAGGALGGFHLLEGTVRRAASARSRVYLNFGEDYRSDFTASARNRLARRWSRAGLDLESLEGMRVRVRGHVEAINGPSVDLTHMRQVEIVDKEAAAR